MIAETYDPAAIEGKWQQVWEKEKLFKAPDPASDPLKRPKYYCLSMFPYPSGAIHMGHVRNYSIGDVTTRYRRMLGFNVMQPIGWDAFGLPAENAALSRGVHPREWTLQNIEQMKSELRTMGFAYDWDRELATCLPEYFVWEQRLFRQFYEKGLAYKKTGFVNWCPKCETVLANEQVQDGLCWRCDSKVEQKELSQWYFKITDYADQLLSGHEQLKGKWPERVLDMQKHWIGESTGCRMHFKVDGGSDSIEIFTTRADTLFGVTFVTIAAAHPLAEKLTKVAGGKEKLEAIKKEVLGRPRDAAPATKNGFFTGSHAIHPVTGRKVPVWVGDFVVMDYGTGAVMAVPAHDQRDYEFAKSHSLPIETVIVPTGDATMKADQAFTEAGKLVNSGEFDGLDSETAKVKIAESLQKAGKGQKTIQYRLRDWGVSRQRYWGAPVPVINCEKDGVVLVPEKDLPVQLPTDIQFKGLTGNPLDHHPTFKKTTCPRCGGPARRETDTMDTFVESSWYYARFTSPRYDKGPVDKKAADSWLPVDCYIGGIEHACMHLLYARFFHKILRDWGYLSGDEPFAKLLTQGMVIKDGAKMSKSKGNVVTPSSIIEKYGADTARLFCLFAAPVEKDLDWNEKGVEGCNRFLARVWRLCSHWQAVIAKGGAVPDKIDDKLLAVRRKAHWMTKKVTEDVEHFKFNTAISACMELVNEIFGLIDKDKALLDTPEGASVLKEAAQMLVLCLAPFAPHIAEELWQGLGKTTRLANEKWPTFQKALLVEDSFLLVIQVNGKVRDKIEMPKGLSKEEIEKQVLANAKVQQFMEGKALRKFIYVPEKIANIVVG